MFAKVFFFALLIALVGAFSPSRFAVKSSTALNADFKLRDDPTKMSPDGRCYEKDLDVKGKCPGDAGYKPPVGNGMYLLLLPIKSHTNQLSAA